MPNMLEGDRTRLFIAWCGCILLLWSCAFDRRFLAPEVIPPQARQGIVIDPVAKDTTYLVLNGPTWQPSFLDRNKQTRLLSYSVESVVFDGVAGRVLNAWIMRPTAQVENDMTILFLHGNAGNITTEYLSMVPLVEAGYRVLLFDYGGFGLSTGKASRKFLLDDAEAALHYLRSRPDEQGRTLTVYGQSLGGHLGVLLAAEHPVGINGLVVEGAFTSYDDIAAHSSGLGFLARAITHSGPSAEAAISKIHVPVLIIHSTEDKVIPYSMGQELFRKANEPKELLTVRGRHCAAPTLYGDSIVEVIKRMTAKSEHR